MDTSPTHPTHRKARGHSRIGCLGSGCFAGCGLMIFTPWACAIVILATRIVTEVTNRALR